MKQPKLDAELDTCTLPMEIVDRFARSAVRHAFLAASEKGFTLSDEAKTLLAENIAERVQFIMEKKFAENKQPASAWEIGTWLEGNKDKV